MKSASFDPSKLLTLYFRVARDGSKKFIFNHANGDPYDISAIDFQLIVKRFKDGDDIINLGIGTGLTVGGADTNELTAAITEELSTIDPAVYFWQLYNVTVKRTWLNGDADFHNGKFDAPDDSETEITITTEGETVTITINEAGSGEGGGDITNIDGGTP